VDDRDKPGHDGHPFKPRALKMLLHFRSGSYPRFVSITSQILQRHLVRRAGRARINDRKRAVLAMKGIEGKRLTYRPANKALA
jgi:hypothetical protein